MRRRILTAIVGVVVLAAAVLTLPLGLVIASRQQADSVLELDRAAERTAAGLGPDVGQPGAEIDLASEEANLSVAVYDRAGKRLAGEGPMRADEIVERRGIATTDGTVGSERVLARPVTLDDRRIATIRVAEPKADTTARVRRDLLLLVAVDAVAVAVAVAVGAVLAARLARPLQAVRDDAVRLGNGDFAIASRSSGVAEIDDTSAALADTAARLEAVLQRERTFSANASHQLRTPVTSMRLAVESELATPRDAPEEVLAEVLADLDRLESTISTLLAVARDLPRTYEPLDPVAAARRLHERWAQRLGRTGRDLAVAGTGDGVVRVSTEVLDEILDVLIDNAGRHGSGTVRVEIDAAGSGMLSVAVADEGRSAVDSATIFQRRPPGRDRHGLGLALARSLAEAEGGRLFLSGTGPTTFRLVLPDRA
ncbi:HAMP domain-containing histidine kinase [Aquihabitans sp. G128]|uniref:sensor histidine kinase n=1 Tax=Aquihabitans sp. G128 TaxID=2849779 RepID=UPI001C22D57D|nr:HAMP domain-containing sensor histidine kinase [Aquihabitans sp. G128]QXC61611.1 HAMP domain-containing histidine kinase [Aquihabitans sp. G128]